MTGKTNEKKPRLLLDEGLPFGLEVYLKDGGWHTEKVTPGTKDDEIVKQAKAQGYLVITQDKQLASRLRIQSVNCISIGVEDLLPLVLDRLKELYPSE